MNTVLYSLGSVTLGLIIATTFAWFLERTNVPFRRAMMVMILVPLGMPMIIASMAWAQLANPANGFLNIVLRMIPGVENPGPLNIYSIPGMIVITGLIFAPLMYLMVSGVFSRVDPSLEEAAKTSGAGTYSVFRRISLPLLGPVLFSAFIYYMIITMETFEIPAMLGMPRDIFVFSSGIFYAINPIQGGVLPNYGIASVYGVILLVLAGIGIYFYGRYIKHAERFATITGRGFRPRLIDLGRWRYVPTVFMSVYFLLIVIMPLLILLWTSLAPPYSTFSMAAFSKLSLAHYVRVLDYPYLWLAIKNTLLISTMVPVITMLLVTIVAWLSVRNREPGAWILDRLTFVVLGIPGIVLAMVLMFIYAPLPFPIYGTIWVIVIAGVTRSLPFGTRLMTAAFLQVHKELEEAATT
ncbi:MAG: ABC transporter permease, partial [Desulforhopalus sp.]